MHYENTSALFMNATSLTPSISADSVDLLLDSFNSKMKNVIDDVARRLAYKNHLGENQQQTRVGLSKDPVLWYQVGPKK